VDREEKSLKSETQRFLQWLPTSKTAGGAWGSSLAKYLVENGEKRDSRLAKIIADDIGIMSQDVEAYIDFHSSENAPAPAIEFETTTGFITPGQSPNDDDKVNMN